jgi:hypothetical protein
LDENIWRDSKCRRERNLIEAGALCDRSQSLPIEDLQMSRWFEPAPVDTEVAMSPAIGVWRGDHQPAAGPEYAMDFG